MIRIGLDAAAKDATVTRYCADHAIRKVVCLSPAKLRFECSFSAHKHVEYAEIIKYRTYYPLFQEIDSDTLLVLNECLRTRDRRALVYNCLRNFLQRTRHQIIFQYLPIVDTLDDVMILVDFATRSRWRFDRFDASMLSHVDVRGRATDVRLEAVGVAADGPTRAKYAHEKARLFAGLGPRDPHTIPRNLYLLSGRAKLSHVDHGRDYVGRNNRFHVERLRTYSAEAFPSTSDVFEFPHAFLDFVDFLSLSRQTHLRALVSDLRVDRWYFERYEAWSRRVSDACQALRLS